jgi:Domain of unknown function (DUF4747)
MAVPVLDVGAINISASPHPEGIYRRALLAVADKEVRIYGSDWAKITDPGPFDDHPDWLFGQILVWSQIDPNKPWLNKQKNTEATAEEKQKFFKALPAYIEPNFRAFNFIFLEKRHRLVLEYRNELGDQFGPERAKRLFSVLLSPKYLSEEFPEFAVTIIPEDDSVEKILQIPRLNWVEFVLERPNADDIGDEAKRVQKQLERLGARQQKIELRKAAKEKTLKLGPKLRLIAKVASLNGRFSGAGKNEDGTKVNESTAKHPKTRSIPVEGTSSFAAFLSSLKFFS